MSRISRRKEKSKVEKTESELDLFKAENKRLQNYIIVLHDRIAKY